MNKDLLKIKIKMYLLCLNKKKVLNLYLDYIKKYVSIYNEIPSFNQKWQSINNCYFYALNLDTPLLINLYAKILTSDMFSINVGNISGLDFCELEKQNEDSLLNCLYNDLRELNIQYYETNINSPLEHNGYKIIVLYDSINNLYHFIRQNKNGLWSAKFGLNPNIYASDNPLLLYNYPTDQYNYKLLKTLEIVKPSK